MISIASWSLPRRMVVLALIGALGALGLAPVGWWWLSLLSIMAVPALFLAAASPRQAALSGWAFGFGWFLPALVWIIEPFLVDVARHGWMAPFALLGFSGGMALFWGAAFWVAHRIARTPKSAIAILILTLSLAEFARAYVLTGLPWAAMAQIWVNTSAIRLLAWIGPHGLGVLTLAIPLAAGFVFTSAGTTKARLLSTAPVLGLIAVIMWIDHVVKGQVSPTTEFTIRLIQPNAPQHQISTIAVEPVSQRKIFEVDEPKRCIKRAVINRYAAEPAFTENLNQLFFGHRSRNRNKVSLRDSDIFNSHAAQVQNTMNRNRRHGLPV